MNSEQKTVLKLNSLKSLHRFDCERRKKSIDLSAMKHMHFDLYNQIQLYALKVPKCDCNTADINQINQFHQK